MPYVQECVQNKNLCTRDLMRTKLYIQTNAAMSGMQPEQIAANIQMLENVCMGKLFTNQCWNQNEYGSYDIIPGVTTQSQCESEANRVWARFPPEPGPTPTPVEPTMEPTMEPTVEPTIEPTVEPTVIVEGFTLSDRDYAAAF